MALNSLELSITDRFDNAMPFQEQYDGKLLHARKAIDHTTLQPGDILNRLDLCRSTRAITVTLLPIFALLLWPIAFGNNEYVYFMQPFRQVAPENFSEFSAAFDVSDARMVWDVVVGHLIVWFGYETAHTVMRLGMAIGYAVAFGLFFNALRLSSLDGIFAVGIFLLMGEQILGKEWLFQGVESKTVAYALVVVGLAFMTQGRLSAAMCMAVVATYVHFLVGGFWFIAFLAYDVLRDWSLRRLVRVAGIYVLLVIPLIALIAYQQFVSLHAPPQQPSANYLYAAFRHPFHVAPFSNGILSGHWLFGSVLLFAMFVWFLFLSRFDRSAPRPFVYWVTGLLGYLLLALGISAFDLQTELFGKFHIFRPSSLTLFCAIVVVLIIFDRQMRKSRFD
jgi:hypothetical protein